MRYVEKKSRGVNFQLWLCHAGQGAQLLLIVTAKAGTEFLVLSLVDFQQHWSASVSPSPCHVLLWLPGHHPPRSSPTSTDPLPPQRTCSGPFTASFSFPRLLDWSAWGWVLRLLLFSSQTQWHPILGTWALSDAKDTHIAQLVLTAALHWRPMPYCQSHAHGAA